MSRTVAGSFSQRMRKSSSSDSVGLGTDSEVFVMMNRRYTKPFVIVNENFRRLDSSPDRLSFVTKMPQRASGSGTLYGYRYVASTACRRVNSGGEPVNSTTSQLRQIVRRLWR